ncbi:hypothetical protein [Fodinibius sp. Rm-B-1B1-1]|uniref:hypothetical protein n=1 Tax=Fodinibius alkaliphilus TaxID=3140241 RepID=UPI00315A0BFB
MTARLTSTIFCILLWMTFSSAGLAQPNAQAVFDDANEQLQAGNYGQALSLYHDLELRNNVSGALFLNMGITYQRIDSLGKAKFYFLKATEFEETEQRAQQALEFVNSQFSRQSAVLPKLPWDVATTWLQKNIGAKLLLFIGILLFNLGIFTFITHWFGQFYPKILRISSYSIVGFAILIITASFYTQYINERYSTAVMITDQISVVENPTEQAPVVSRAYEGYTFTVDHYQSQDQPKWSYIRMSNGLYGWIPNSEILIL